MTMSNLAYTQSTIALMEAHEAEVRSCKALISSYHAETASVGQMQEYAHCVSMVYPLVMSPAELIVVKIALTVAFIGFAVGAWRGWNDDRDLVSVAVYGLLGFLITPVLLGIALAIIGAFLWLVGVI